MPTPYRSRTSDLSSALFDRATPEPLPLSPDAGAARASQISGRMGWAHDGAAVLLKAEQRIEPSQQPALASCGVFDGTPQFPAAGKHSQPEPRARSPATRQPEAGVLSPEQRKILSLTTSAVMRESIAPGDDEDDLLARSALRAHPLAEEEAAELTWIRVDGLARDNVDRALIELAARASSLASAPLAAYRALTDPIQGTGKGVAFLAFAAPGFADLTDVVHELRLLGYAVAPIAYRQMCALLG